MQIRFCEICTNFETVSRSYLCLEKQGEIRLHHFYLCTHGTRVV